jgi:SAM-dependent methyltransferase
VISLREEVVARYLETTALRSLPGAKASRDYYEEMWKRLAPRLRPWLPTDRRARCVELGAGCGEALYGLEREGFNNVAGVELCAEELERVRSYVRSQLVCGDAVDYLTSCQSNSVDFVLALNFLEHLPKDVLLTLLRQVSRVLRPGGTLVAMVPNAVSPIGGMTRHWDMTHEWAFVPNNFYQLSALAGFAPNIEFRECGPFPRGLISGIRYLLWQAVRGLIAFRLLIETASSKGGIYTMDMLVRMHASAPKEDV